ncbi:hypothetical protein [Geothrix oryzae]|uniref:hypothetical protein n=1 Tax=Geothrix oryzae TaxID=2927975 RepID=UPI00257377C9|nr:hypothetical protein [Geothrix oryzae]
MSPEASIALGSASVALCALVVSLWQVAVQRSHNKLSVRPYLHADRFSLEGHPFKWQVVNAGAGPAVIRKFLVKIDKDELLFPSISILTSTLRSRGVIDLASTWNCKKGDYILTKQPVILLHIPHEQAKNYLSTTSKITWNIEYESIYGDIQTLIFSAEIDS